MLNTVPVISHFHRGRWLPTWGITSKETKTGAVTTQLELEEEIVEGKKTCICSDAPWGYFFWSVKWPDGRAFRLAFRNGALCLEPSKSVLSSLAVLIVGLVVLDFMDPPATLLVAAFFIV